MSRTTRTVATAGLAALAPVGVVLTRILTDGEVPDPMPTHWDLHGRVDDHLAPTTLFWVSLLVSVGCLALTVLLAARSREDRADRSLVAAGAWATWLAAMVFVAPALMSYGAADADAVPLDLGWVAAVPLLPTAVAALVWRLQRVASRPRAGDAGRRSALQLRDGERATWVGRSSSGVLVGLAGGLLVVAVFLVFTAWPVANLVALVAIAVFWSHVVTVRVDDRAVTVAWGPARWPRLRVPLEQVETARAEEIEPMRWGGWGYRVSRRGQAVVTRRGPGLVLERRDGAAFAVTVDDPEGAAELVNALLDRETRSRG
jgi:hypothetical protein